MEQISYTLVNQCSAYNNGQSSDIFRRIMEHNGANFIDCASINNMTIAIVDATVTVVRVFK